MRIAQVAPVATTIPPPKSGSVELMTYLLAEALVARGHEVTLFATADSKTNAQLHAIYERGYWDDVDMWPWEFCEMMNLAAACERASDFDVIHYQAAYYPMSLAFVRLVRTPIVQTIHHYPPPSQIALWKQYPEANFVAISQCQYDAMEGLNRLGTVYHGIDTSSFTFRSDPEDYLVFLGRFTEGKGPLQAIEVAKRLGMRLVLAAPPDPYYYTTVQQHVGGLIEYAGEVNHEQKDRLLGGARALLYPIQTGEPFGLVLVEAMSCGTPVVALDKGAVSEIVIDGVNGYRARDLDEMVKLVPRAVELDRAAVRRNAVERFDVGRMAEEYVTLYEKVARRRAPKVRLVR
jgi:glycosyltransferase involved in cell wall biosynthesis